MRRGLVNVVLAKPLSIASPAGQQQFSPRTHFMADPETEIGRAAFNVTLNALLRIQEYISEAASLMP